MASQRSILHRTLRHGLRIAAGLVLFAIGIVGLLLPIMPGWPFIVSAILLIWPDARLAIWIKHLPARAREWYRRRKSPSP